MPTVRNPRKGSMQFWHRQRASRPYARIRSWISNSKETKPLGFLGYKVGMGHAIIIDNRPNSNKKNERVSWPFTVIECPPLKVFGYALYKKDAYGIHKAGEIHQTKNDKDLLRKIPIQKKQHDGTILKAEDYHEIRLLVHTQPNLTTLPKKKPEVFEMGIGGKSAVEKLQFAQAQLGKEILVSDAISAGNQLDSHAVTKGHGIQGPVKRHGVSLRAHKSEKTKRGPGNVGPWHGNRSWTVAHAGQDGYHQRFQHHSYVLKIGEKNDPIIKAGGFHHYGEVRNQYILIKGSVGGPTKRAIIFTHSMRPESRYGKETPKIERIIV